MLAVWKLPNDIELTEIESMVTTRATTLWGVPVVWPSTKMVPLVYISSFNVPASGRHERVHLLGARYELSGALVDGKDYSPGYAEEFFVATFEKGNQWQIHRLRQRGTTVYSSEYERGDDFPADEIDNPRELSLDEAPIWKPTNIEWPTLSERPMKFVGQISLPENSITREHLTWDTNVYLFWLGQKGKDHFKITTQPTTLQTADEHYAEEDATWREAGRIPDDE